MKNFRFVLLSSALINISYPAYAQTALSDPMHLRVARNISASGSSFAAAFRGLTPASFAPASVSVSASGGAVIPYVGVAAVGAGVVMAALAAHYNSMADSDLDALGRWYKTGVSLPAPSPIVVRQTGLMIYPLGVVCQGVSDAKSHIGYIGRVRPDPDDHNVKDRYFAMYSHWSDTGKAEYISSKELGGNNSSEAYQWFTSTGSCKSSSLSTLGSIINSNPQIASQLADIVSRYVGTHPESLGQMGWEVYPNVNQLDDALIDPSLDTDADGYTDAAEVKAKTDPSNAKSKPTTKPDAGTKTDAPSIPKPDEPKEKEPKKKKEPPVSNDCGDLSLARALKFPAHVLRDIFIPCDKDFFVNYFNRLHNLISSKFPFGFIESLRSTNISVSGGSNQGALPTSLGMFILDWSSFSSLFAFASMFFKAAISFLGINFLISKLSAQVVIK